MHARVIVFTAFGIFNQREERPEVGWCCKLLLGCGFWVRNIRHRFEAEPPDIAGRWSAASMVEEVFVF